MGPSDTHSQVPVLANFRRSVSALPRRTSSTLMIVPDGSRRPPIQAHAQKRWLRPGATSSSADHCKPLHERMFLAVTCETKHSRVCLGVEKAKTTDQVISRRLVAKASNARSRIWSASGLHGRFTQLSDLVARASSHQPTPHSHGATMIWLPFSAPAFNFTSSSILLASRFSSCRRFLSSYFARCSFL